MKASEELTDEQIRQVGSGRHSNDVYPAQCLPQLSFDIEHAYNEFFRSLSGKDNSS